MHQPTEDVECVYVCVVCFAVLVHEHIIFLSAAKGEGNSHGKYISL